MSTQTDTDDRAMLDFIRREGAVTISALVDEMGVTATAVRQRLQRLMDSGLDRAQDGANQPRASQPSVFTYRTGRTIGRHELCRHGGRALGGDQVG